MNQDQTWPRGKEWGQKAGGVWRCQPGAGAGEGSGQLTSC